MPVPACTARCLRSAIAEAHGVGHLALPEPGLAAARQLGHHPLQGDGDSIRHRIDATGRL